jgi:phage terminase large subunit
MVLAYNPRGAALSFWVNPAPARFMDILYEGPAGTGKTFGTGVWIHQLLKESPRRARVLVVRQTLRSLRETVQVTYEEKIVRHETPYWRRILNGRSRDHRTNYRYPHGPEIVLGGLDNPGKWDSSEFDVVWLEEAREVSLRASDRLKRCLRNNALGWHCMIRTTNPGNEYSYLNQMFPPGHRMAPAGTGDRLRLLSRHEDNPTVTEEYLRFLRSMHGAERAQLYEGKWCGESGRVWPQYDEGTHLLDMSVRDFAPNVTLIDALHPEEGGIHIKWCAASMDFGYRNPGCFIVWGIDADRNAYALAEVYQSGMNQGDWAETISRLYKEFRFRVVVADCAEAGTIDFLNTRLGRLYGKGIGKLVIPANKSRGKQHGLDVVRTALVERRIFFLRPERRMRTAWKWNTERDEWQEIAAQDITLKLAGKPTHATAEIPGYVFLSITGATTASAEAVRASKELPDPSCPDHGCDAIEYFATWMWGDRRPSLAPEKAQADKHFPDDVPAGMSR